MLETRTTEEKVALEKVANLFWTYKEGKKVKVTLSEGQTEIFRAILQRSPDRVHVMCPTQYGKLISDDTPVLTGKGWKTHGELKVGDYVWSDKGRAVKITAVHPKGIADRAVVFSNGEVIKCNKKHEWVVKRKGHFWKIKETEEIARAKTLHTIPNISPLQFSENNTPVDYYTLGAWLGDGMSKKPSITGHKDDADIISRIPYKVSKIHIHKQTGVLTYDFWGSGLLEGLKSLSVFNNKHIPEVYFYGSVAQRLELLAGLIDTDGHVSPQFRGNHRQVYFTNTNKRLIDDFVRLIRSLGFRDSVVTVNLSSSGIRGVKAVYIVGFQPHLDIPTALLRKKICAQPKKRGVRITNIIEIPPVIGNCITVEGGIYLVGERLIPTHNSFTVSMAVLLRASAKPEKWAIVAPSEAKAKIIMRYVIEHIGNNQIFIDQLDVNDPWERLRKEQSKTRITFKRGGEIFILSADAKNKASAGESLMGFGAPNVIIDESSLIDDDIYAKIKRMVGGSADNFLLEIGNPFKRNHFLRSFRDDNYHKIIIDWKRAVSEGRLLQKFVDEMRREAFFEVLYECSFPSEEDIDSEGWTRMFTDQDIEGALTEDDPNAYGEQRMGIDVARGGNFNVWVRRFSNFAAKPVKTTSNNLMDVIGTSKQIAKQYDVDDSRIYLDATGMGAGVYDRFRETGWVINGVNLSSKADNAELYANKRAENYFRLQKWIKEGGKLSKSNEWFQLTDIKYKLRSSGKLKIIDKDTLRIKGIPSPDVADSLMLTFDDPEGSIWEERVHVMETRAKQRINRYE